MALVYNERRFVSESTPIPTITPIDQSSFGSAWGREAMAWCYICGGPCRVRHRTTRETMATPGFAVAVPKAEPEEEELWE